MKIITVKQIIKQLIADLIGKDSYRGVTLTYSWLANQFGHFSLGYIPSLITYSVLKKYTLFNHPSTWAAIIISIIWLLFEAYNFLGPLLIKKQSKSKLLFISSGSEYVFQPAWGNVAYDTFTDLCFFWLGAFSVSLFLLFSWTIVFILFILSIMLFYPVGYWFVTKMYIQYARLPIQFRLSQWQGELTDTDKITILNFLNKEDLSLGNHLLMFGGRRSGKSPLCVGIGTEFSIRRFPCSYYTGMKLYNLFSLTDKEILDAENCDVWSWRTASLLIIDDINPGSPITENFISPEELLSIINTTVIGDSTIKNKDALVKKNVIWVMGDDKNELNKIDNWRKMLLDMGVQENKIYAIHLRSSFTE